MEVPRLRVKLELQLPAYTTATAMPDLNRISAYTMAHSNARSLTHDTGPGMELTVWQRQGQTLNLLHHSGTPETRFFQNKYF